ncbi:hypothetical protein BZA05DRAFT_414341 [Tricharina praecox]|uniref:uncharacterized protein n=1 Tax=Tricharina praecox TaxID=43433 RepID=UPI0022206C8D|nr:uncharacterized protein BZA05DRAFT_414341 [Tricharina praecox]KAI5858554.1 hypothetical protein BZA05DRAFT_414341 [Tricharina praecox]
MNPTSAPRISASALVLRKISSVLHPPLPLTPRESHTLLRAVQDSFRQSLTSASSADTSASAHLGSLLKMQPFAPTADAARRMREQRIKKYLVDPIAVFEEHVALGTASVELARSCLARYNDLGEGRVGDGGSRVLRGLVEAGAIRSPREFLDEVPLSHPLVMALVREGKGGVLVKWILERDGKDGIARQLVRQVEKQLGLERATQVFFEFYNRMVDTMADTMPQQLGTIGRELCRDARKTGRLPQPLLERLLATAEKWAVNRAEHAMILLRFGDDVKPGLRFFATIDYKPALWWNELPERRQQRYAQMGIELAQKCLAQENLKDAQAVAKMVSKRFREQLGVQSQQHHQQTEDVDGLLPRGEVAEHLDVFREMFKEAIQREEQVAADGLV